MKVEPVVLEVTSDRLAVRVTETAPGDLLLEITTTDGAGVELTPYHAGEGRQLRLRVAGDKPVTG